MAGMSGPPRKCPRLRRGPAKPPPVVLATHAGTFRRPDCFGRPGIKALVIARSRVGPGGPSPLAGGAAVERHAAEEVRQPGDRPALVQHQALADAHTEAPAEILEVDDG